MLQSIFTSSQLNNRKNTDNKLKVLLIITDILLRDAVVGAGAGGRWSRNSEWGLKEK